MMQENNISYLKPINLNKEKSIRFKNSNELNHLERYFIPIHLKNILINQRILDYIKLIIPMMKLRK